jgi:hypothetical protein
MHIANTTDGWRKQYEGIEVECHLREIATNNRISGMTPSALCPCTSATAGGQARSVRLGFLKSLRGDPRPRRLAGAALEWGTQSGPRTAQCSEARQQFVNLRFSWSLVENMMSFMENKFMKKMQS